MNRPIIGFPILQPCCLRCLADHDEQFQPQISYSTLGCLMCGYIPPMFFEQRAYQAALNARRRQADFRIALKERFAP